MDINGPHELPPLEFPVSAAPMLSVPGFSIFRSKYKTFCQATVHNKIRRKRRAAKLARKARQIHNR